MLCYLSYPANSCPNVPILQPGSSILTTLVQLSCTCACQDGFVLL